MIFIGKISMQISLQCKFIVIPVKLLKQPYPYLKSLKSDL